MTRRGERCRIAFLGCGRATTELHLPALRSVPDIDVVAVCDADGDAARRTAQAFGVPHAHDDLAALLGRADLHAVAVCVPPEHHAAAACAVLDAGLHLFLEKPLAPNHQDCERIAEHAAHAGRHVVIGFNLRGHRLVLAARERIRAGALGTIELVRSTFTSDGALRADLSAWRRTREQGGGVIFELGVHHFDLWRFLTGLEFEEIFAYRTGEGTHDRAATVTARAAGGAMATAQLDEATHAANEIEMFGTAGGLRVSLYDFDGLRVTAAAVPPGGIGGRIRGLGHTLGELPAAVVAARGGGDFRASFVAEWQRFADTVLRGAPPAASLDDGLAATRMSIAAAQSVVTGRPVRV